MSAPPDAVTVGNEVTAAAMRSGTSAPPRNSGTTEPIARLFASMNALVAMAGIAATAAAPGSSSNCPVTCADDGDPEVRAEGGGARPGSKLNVAARAVPRVRPSVGGATEPGGRLVGTGALAC